MKKNKMMRIASVLLVAVLLSTCAISGTFAKYVTSDSGSDTARVAKWGVEISLADDLGAFLPKYETDETGTGAYVGTHTVACLNDAEDLVAPGTKGSMSFTIIFSTLCASLSSVGYIPSLPHILMQWVSATVPPF